MKLIGGKSGHWVRVCVVPGSGPVMGAGLGTRDALTRPAWVGPPKTIQGSKNNAPHVPRTAVWWWGIVTTQLLAAACFCCDTATTIGMPCHHHSAGGEGAGAAHQVL